jgi:alcohol dehydrogenase class IV
MNIVTLLQPPRIVIGDGCAPQCAEFLAQRGVGRVLLVSSTPVLPTLGGIMEALKRSGIAMIQSPMVDCEPTRTMFEQLLALARQENIEGVLGIGGGSAIDVASTCSPAAHCRWCVCPPPQAPARKFHRMPSCLTRRTN